MKYFRYLLPFLFLFGCDSPTLDEDERVPSPSDFPPLIQNLNVFANGSMAQYLYFYPLKIKGNELYINPDSSGIYTLDLEKNVFLFTGKKKDNLLIARSSTNAIFLNNAGPGFQYTNDFNFDFDFQLSSYVTSLYLIRIPSIHSERPYVLFSAYPNYVSFGIPSNEKIYLFNIEDGTTSLLLEARKGSKSGSIFNPVTNFDFSKIAYGSYEYSQRSQIVIADISKNERTYITDTTFKHISPGFSPDGNLLGFIKYDGGIGYLIIHDVNANKPIQSIPFVREFDWIDTQNVLFVKFNGPKSRSNTNYTLWKVNINTLEEKQLTFIKDGIIEN